MRHTLNRFLAALTHSGPGYQPTTGPRRGDMFEAWLKARRDEYEVRTSPQWQALDDLLDLYRLHADTGTQPADNATASRGHLRLVHSQPEPVA